MSEDNKNVLESEDRNEATEEHQPTDEQMGEGDEQPSVDQEASESSQDDHSGEEPEQNLDQEPDQRPVHTVPVYKFNEMRKAEREARERAEKLEQELREARESRPPATREESDQIQKYAEEKGITYEAAEALVDLAKKEVDQRLKPYEKHLENQEIESHKRQVADEFDSKITDRIARDFPGATQSFINEIKESITGLAFTKKYNTYALEDIYEVNKHGFNYQNKQSAESSGGGVRDIVDFDNVSDGDIEKMSPSEYKAYSDYMASKENSWDGD